MTQVALQLSDELNEFVQKAVLAGDFQDTEAFFESLLYNLKEQSEAELTDDDQVKLAALQADVRQASDQLDRGEGVRDFDYDLFLAERHEAYNVARLSHRIPCQTSSYKERWSPVRRQWH